ncbi:hypothetical protein [Anaerococcus tetradius]|uniref:hypothetical protein n=1 Tax=Anaerococcus tetradius TaxID=33036 RepID=UPI0023F23F06|nr:hypothetical protein [Anaerococcus tetradius]
MKNQEKILDEIMEDRNKLLKINKEIEGINKSIPFWKIFAIPLFISLLVFALSFKFSFTDSQRIGIFMVLFALTLVIFTLNTRKNIRIQKDILIDERKKLQHKIFEKTKLMANEENNSENS